MVRRCRALAFLLLGLGAFSASAQAQALGGFGMGDIMQDPFAFYYAYYLPNQQIQAMRPRPTDAINQAVMQRQYYANMEKPRVYDPISPYTAEPYDPLKPYARQQGQERSANPYRFALDPSNATGSGPAAYYGRAAQYFPTLRQGRGPNANVASGARRGPGGHRGGRGMGGMGMGGMGMGGMGMGMPG